MFSLLTLGFASFLLAFLFTPLTRNLFRRLGVLDHPDQRRKVHAAAIPRVGGIPIALAFLGAFGILLAVQLKGGLIIMAGLPFAWRLLPAAGLILLTGLLDDLVGLKPWQKLLGQFAASAYAIWAGVQIHRLNVLSLDVWWSVPLTLVWLIGCTNAFNLIDGVDGLAAGIGLFATVTTLVAALVQHNVELAYATAPLAGALLGFLRFNFNPASIFLGDSGSMLIGFLLGCYGVLWSQKSATLLGMTAPLMALSIPLLDTAIAIIRRFLHRQPIFTGDNGHIHHRLLARGLTPRRVALLLYGVCGLAAMFSLLQSFFNQYYGGLVVVLFCAAAWIGIQHLGYIEFGMAGRLVLPRGFRRMLSAQLALRSLEERLAAAETADQCCHAIWDVAGQLGFTDMRCRLSGHLFTAAADNPPEVPTWTVRIQLTSEDYVNLARPFDRREDAAALAALVELIHKSLLLKLPSFPHAVAAASGR